MNAAGRSVWVGMPLPQAVAAATSAGWALTGWGAGGCARIGWGWGWGWGRDWGGSGCSAGR